MTEIPTTADVPPRLWPVLGTAIIADCTTDGFHLSFRSPTGAPIHFQYVCAEGWWAVNSRVYGNDRQYLGRKMTAVLDALAEEVAAAH